MTRALLIAAPRSGSGKTTMTLGLIAAFRARGVAVRAAKAGPDYIDGAFHTRATGRPTVNLDSWAMPPALLRHLAQGDEPDSDDLLIVEAAMGLFDGAGIAGPGGGDGSAASLARTLDLPVLLVIDASGQAQSAAAVAHGFASFDPSVRVAGVVANRVAGPRHRARIDAGLSRTAMPVLGAIGRDATLALPERHLGLVQAREHHALDAWLVRAGEAVAAAIDLDAVFTLSAPFRPVAAAPPPVALSPPGQRIALARDDAFSFTYPHVLRAWREAGATVVPFSPLADEAPDPDADAVWLPGGYPELHAGRLAAAARFGAGMRRAGANGVAIHGECGGYMVLGRMLADSAGERHPMLDLLDHQTSFAARRLALGYRVARLRNAGALGAAGTRIAGHEFHHATIAHPGTDRPLATVTDGDGAPLGCAGGARGSVSGSFFHSISVVA